MLCRVVGFHAGTGCIMTVFFSVFAGRRRYLTVLMTYVHPLLEHNIVDVVHVWDYARVPADKEYLRTLADPAKRVEVISPPESDRTARFPNKWKGYYKHYAVLLKADDILIKCDDDVVFMANVHVLLNEVRRDQGAHLMYYPSVVNNDVAAAFQAADGVISDPEYVIGLRTSWNESRYSRAPMSDWFNCSQCAEHVHERFLASPDTFFTGCRHEWNVACRVPINFFAMPGRNVQSHFGSYMHEQYVDEPYFTALLTERTGLPSLLVSDAVVVHFSFSFQHMADERSMLDRYRQLARDDALHVRLRTKFGSRALSSSCPTEAPVHLLQNRRQPSPPVGRGYGRSRGRGGYRGAGGAAASSDDTKPREARRARAT